MRNYEKGVAKTKARLAAKADERKRERQEREQEIRGKYGIFKDAKTPLLEEGQSSSRY